MTADIDASSVAALSDCIRAARLARQYRQRITNLSLRRRPPKTIGKRSATMPRWTHVRQR
jgi:hypothetical protein